MGRGAGKQMASSNVPVKTREMVRRSRNHLLRGGSQSNLKSPEDKVDTTIENHINCKDLSPVSAANHVASKCNSYLKKEEIPLDNQRTKCDASVIYETSTTTCIITTKSSKILSNGIDGFGKSQIQDKIQEKCDVQSRVHSCSNDIASGIVEKKCCDTNKVLNNEDTSFSDGKYTSSLCLELVLHFNTVIYMMFSLSIDPRLKVASHDMKPIVDVDPFTMKIISTFSLGILADFASPMVALVIPQVTCLLTGVLLTLQISPELVACVAHYLPQLNSGLIGTQLLLRLSKPPENFAAALSRVNCIYCLMDLFSPWLLRMMTLNLGYTLSYQVMTISSFLGLVGVLYLFHTNHSKEAYVQSEQSLFKSVLMRLSLGIPVALLLPRFQYLLRSVGHLNRYSIVGVITTGLVFQQAVMVPVVQVLSTPMKFIGASAVLLALLYLSMIIMETTSIGILLLILIYGVVGIVQNFIVAFLVTSYPGSPGFLLAINLTLHFAIRYFTELITGDMTLNFVSVEQVCLKANEWFGNVRNDNFLRAILGDTIFNCNNIYMNVIYLISSISSAVLLVVAKHI